MHHGYGVQGRVAGFPGEGVDPAGADGFPPEEAGAFFIRGQGLGAGEAGQGGFRMPAGGFLAQEAFQGGGHAAGDREVFRPQGRQVSQEGQVLRGGPAAAAQEHMTPGDPVLQGLLLFFRQGRRIHVVQHDHAEGIQQLRFLRQRLRGQGDGLPVFIAGQHVVLLVDVQVRQVPRPGAQHADHHRGGVDDPRRRRVHRQQLLPALQDFHGEHILLVLNGDRQHHRALSAGGHGDLCLIPVVFQPADVGVDRQRSFQIFRGGAHRDPHGDRLSVGDPPVVAQLHLRRQGRVRHLCVQAFRQGGGEAREQAQNQSEGQQPSEFLSHTFPPVLSCGCFAAVCHDCRTAAVQPHAAERRFHDPDLLHWYIRSFSAGCS